VILATVGTLLLIRPLQDPRARHRPIGDPPLQFQEDLIAPLDLAHPAANVCFRERGWMSHALEIWALNRHFWLNALVHGERGRPGRLILGARVSISMEAATSGASPLITLIFQSLAA
jgi:hypothetical protein